MINRGARKLIQTPLDLDKKRRSGSLFDLDQKTKKKNKERKSGPFSNCKIVLGLGIQAVKILSLFLICYSFKKPKVLADSKPHTLTFSCS